MICDVIMHIQEQIDKLKCSKQTSLEDFFRGKESLINYVIVNNKINALVKYTRVLEVQKSV